MPTDEFSTWNSLGVRCTHALVGSWRWLDLSERLVMEKSTAATKVAIANFVVNVGRLAVAVAAFIRDGWPL